MRMLPAVEPLYPAAKAVFTPWLRFGLRWTIEGLEQIPRQGPVILASNHTSYLDPLALAWVADRRGRRVRFLAKAELFDKPVLGAMLRAIRQIPVARGQADAARSLDAAVAALEAGECVAVFPEGTISTDLDPIAPKSGTARLAHRSGVPVVPVGLWGAHRILTKHRKPAWRWGIPEVAVVGRPLRVEAGEHVRATTARVTEAIGECVARAREIYPDHPKGDADAWWWREPKSALRPVRPGNGLPGAERTA
jgi:1-acyl-sn-glycerol-3-phosphate acyltransferase